ncbi:hypothetical protein ACWGI8_41980 [Streptomyces sp. NPDC054841]
MPRVSRTWARVALAVGLVGVVINLIDWAVSGKVAASDAFPLFLAAEAASELTTGPRRRALRAAAGVVLLAAGFAAGIPAATGLIRGGSVDWLGLTLGVLVVLYAVVITTALVARRREQGSSPA